MSKLNSDTLFTLVIAYRWCCWADRQFVVAVQDHWWPAVMLRLVGLYQLALIVLPEMTPPPPVSTHRHYTDWAKILYTAYDFHCNNFLYSQSVFIIFGTLLYTIRQGSHFLENRGMSPFSRRFRRQSPFSATVAVFVDSVDRALEVIFIMRCAI